MNTKAKIAAGILGAVAAGVVIGLLLAPDKGEETRKKIKKKAGSWADTIGHLFANGKEEADEVKEKVRHGKAVAEEKVNKLKENLG
jgi:gas vesicle protein